MKTILTMAAIIFLMGCQQATSPSSDSSEKEEKQVEVKSNKTIALQVEGMTCEGCEKTIEGNVKGLEGVASVKADHKKGMTTVEFDSTMVDRARFVTTINSTGYKVVESK